MAATTIKTGVAYDSYFWVKWESGEQDVSANKTTINWSCGVMPGHKFYSNAVKMSAVSIGGVTVYAGGRRLYRGLHQLSRLRHAGGQP